MRYLIYSIYSATPHYETELEIAQKLINEGHQVYFLKCNSKLDTCKINPDHDLIKCLICQSKLHDGFNAINVPKEQIYELPKYQNLDYVIPEYTTIKELKEVKYKGSDVGLAVASSLITSLRDNQFDVRLHDDIINRGLLAAMKVHDGCEAMLEVIKPDVVVIFNGRFLEIKPLMRLCEKMGIDYYTHERGGVNSLYSYRKNTTPHTLKSLIEEIDTYWEKDDELKVEKGALFFKERRNGVIQSWLSFTDQQSKNALPENFDHTKINIGIFNSSMDEYETIPDFTNPIYNDDNDAIEKLCDSFKENLAYHFYLRVHPNLKGLDNYQIKAIKTITGKFNNLTVIAAEDAVDTYALIDAVDKVVTFSSTIGVESLYWGTPSILLGRAIYERIEGIIVPNNHEEAVKILQQKLPVPDKNGAIKYGYWCLHFGVPYKYFVPESLFTGKFKNKYIRGNFVWRFLNRLMPN